MKTGYAKWCIFLVAWAKTWNQQSLWACHYPHGSMTAANGVAKWARRSSRTKYELHDRHQRHQEAVRDISMASIYYRRRREFERNYLGTEIEAEEDGRGAKLGENETASLVVRRDRRSPGVAFRPLFRDYCICSPNEVNCPKLLSSV